MDVGWGVEPDSRVLVVMVIPIHKLADEDSGVVQGSETLWKYWTIISGLVQAPLMRQPTINLSMMRWSMSQNVEYRPRRPSRLARLQILACPSKTLTKPVGTRTDKILPAGW